jgi:hypothetical protein
VSETEFAVERGLKVSILLKDLATKLPKKTKQGKEEGSDNS